jgi:hypothetical protein
MYQNLGSSFDGDDPSKPEESAIVARMRELQPGHPVVLARQLNDAGLKRREADQRAAWAVSKIPSRNFACRTRSLLMRPAMLERPRKPATIGAAREGDETAANYERIARPACNAEICSG